MIQKGISVIVCCYNSSLLLPETLKHLALQKLVEDIPWEVIIVNNASFDNTEEAAFNEWSKYNASAGFKVVSEQEQGIIYARKKGLSFARYEYILFCDDDNWLQNDYLEKAFQLMEKLPDAGALGGCSEVVTDGLLPEWWEENKNSFAVGNQAVKSGDVTQRGYLWGAGLITRKIILDSVFDSRYPFILSGRKGNQVISGDDSEICSRIILLGWKLYYHEDLNFKHFLPKERLTDEYRDKLIAGFESTYGIQKKYKLAIELVFTPLINKITISIKKIAVLFWSKFDKRKVDLLKAHFLFAFGFRFVTDRDYLLIYKFARQK